MSRVCPDEWGVLITQLFIIVRCVDEVVLISEVFLLVRCPDR